MRHRISKRKLNRTSAHRRAMQRNLAQSLFEHGQVRTTLAKAKDIRPFAERLISLAKKARGGSVPARRRIHKLLSDRSLVPKDHQEAYELLSDAKRAATLRAPSGRRYRRGVAKGRLAFTGESITHRLINTIAARYEDRPGGYTRLIRLADVRVGDHGAQAIVQLVGDEEGPGAVAKPDKTARRRRADGRYALAVKLGRWKPRGDKKVAADEAPEQAGEEAAAGEESEAKGKPEETKAEGPDE